MIINMMGYSRRRVSDLTVNGITIAVIPSTKAMLVIFEPSALPTAKAGLPWEAAIIEIRISGAEVPIPTMVSPIISGGTPKFLAIAEAP